MSDLKGMELREAIRELERQKPKNKEEFEFREAEIKRLIDLLPREKTYKVSL